MQTLTNITTPEQLFNYGSPDELKEQYRRLALKHHPDKGGDVADFQKVKDFYEKAVILVESNSLWDTGSSIFWQGKDATLQMDYLVKNKISVGSMYAANTRILYTISQDNADLSQSAIKMISFCREKLGPNTKLSETNGSLLPILDQKTVNDALLIQKRQDEYQLRSVLQSMGTIPTVHVVWAIGRLLHILCYLEWRGVVHSDISVDNLWVNPKHHSLHLYGGWWYSKKVGEKLSALSQRSVNFASLDMIKNKIANKTLDFELVRQTAIELLGVPSGTELRKNKALPSKFVDFLSSPFAATTAVELYSQWEKVRDSSFGERKFVEFLFNPSSIYKR